MALAWYSTGTIAVPNNGNTVTGTSTVWLANADIGQGILLPDGRTYEITNITTDLALNIKPNYIGTTVVSAGAYQIVPIQGYLRSTSAQIVALLATAAVLLALSPSDKDIIQYRSTSYTTRTLAQYAADLAAPLAAGVITALGVNMVPVNVLDITQSQNGSSIASLLNASTGASAVALFRAVNNLGKVAAMQIQGGGTSTSGIFTASGAVVYSDAAGGLSVGTISNTALLLGTNNVVRATLDNAGTLGLAVNTPSTWTIIKALEMGAVGNFVGGAVGDVGAYMGAGCYYNSGWKYSFTSKVSAKYEHGGSGHTWSMAAVGTLGAAITWQDALSLSGIGNTSTSLALANANTGTSVIAEFRASVAVNSIVMRQYGSGFTASGVNRQDGGIISCSGAGGLTFNTNAAQPIYFSVNNVECARFSSIGGLSSNRGNTGSIANNTFVNIFSPGNRGMYLVHAMLPSGSGAPAAYTAYALVMFDGNGSGGWFIITKVDGTNLVITVSGSNVQVKQTSGATQGTGIDWSYLYLGMIG